MSKGLLAGVALAVVAAGTMLAPKPAEAYWTRWGWRGPAYYVGPPPVVVAAPPPVIVAAPYRHWVRAHYNRFGYFVPGHWS